MTYREWVREVVGGKIRRGYLLTGESFQREEALSLLLSRVVDPATKSFNLDLFYGDDVDLDRMTNTVLSFPMLAQRRMVVLKECQALNSEAWKKLARVLADPPETTCVVLTGDDAKLQNKLSKEAKRHISVVVFKPIYDNRIEPWIRDRVRKEGKDISPKATALLRTYVGTSLWDLANEIEKLFIFIGDRGRIEEDDVVQVVGHSKIHRIFDLTDAVGERKTGEALQILQSLLDEGEEPGRMLWMLVRHLTALSKIVASKTERLDRTEWSRRLGISPYFLEKTMAQAAHFDEETLADGMERVLDVENRLKSGYRNERVLLEMLVYGLCQKRKVNKNREIRETHENLA